MISRFEHSEKAHYLVLCTEQKEEKMADRMLLQNEMKGLLPVKIEWMNGCKEYYYDISSKHSLSSIVKKGSLNVSNIQILIRTIGMILNQFHEFMLEPDGICLSEELIYTSLPEWNLMFCYFEEDGKVFLEKLRKLLQFVIEYVDYQDKEAVALAYACYQEAMQENVTFDRIEDCLLRKGRLEESENRTKRGDCAEGEYKKEEVSVQENRRQYGGVRLATEPRILSEVMEEEAEESSFDEEKAKRISCYIIGTGCLLTGVLWLAASEGLFDSFSILSEILPVYIAFAGVVLTLLAFIVWSVIKRQWKEKTRLVTKEIAYPFEQREQKTRSAVEEAVYPSKRDKQKTEEEREEHQRKSNFSKEYGEKEDREKEREKEGIEYGKTVLLSYRVEEEHRVLFSCQEGYPSIEIMEFPCSIGKLPSLNQAVIVHKGISRIHCSIQKEEDGSYSITDRNSTNGVIVNGKRLIPNEAADLPMESEIVLGILHYIFR